MASAFVFGGLPSASRSSGQRSFVKNVLVLKTSSGRRGIARPSASRVLRRFVANSISPKFAVPSIRADADSESNKTSSSEVNLMAFAAPLALLAAAEPNGLATALQPFADYFTKLDLPPVLVQWGHPVMMSIVLFAMGGTGAYAGWQIRLNKTAPKGERKPPKEIAKLIELHTSLMPGAFFFFILGASGGLLSTLMQGFPIQESPHYGTALLSLGLFGLTSLLPLGFKGKAESLRTAHAYLGSLTFAVLLLHFFTGLSLGFS